MTVRVRINPKLTAQSRYRCGMAFGREWQEVDRDAATVARLRADQMLEVMDVPAPAPAPAPAPEPAPAPAPEPAPEPAPAPAPAKKSKAKAANPTGDAK